MNLPDFESHVDLSKIKHRTKNNIRNHFKLYFLRKNSLAGAVTENNVVVWRRNILFGAFYPIICINHQLDATPKIKMNPFGKFIIISFFILMLISWLLIGPIKEPKDEIIGLLFLLIFMSPIAIILILIYRREYRNEAKKIIALLGESD